MGTSRQGPTENQIIDDPELQSPVKRLLEKFITVGLWSLWAYWIIPVFTAMLWFLGFKFFASRLMDKEIFNDLLKILSGGWIIICVILLANLLWIYYNYEFIYKKKGNRRRTPRNCPENKLAKYFSIDPEKLAQAKNHPRLDLKIKGRRLDIEYYCNICTGAEEAFSNIDQGKCKYGRCVHKISTE